MQLNLLIQYCITSVDIFVDSIEPIALMVCAFCLIPYELEPILSLYSCLYTLHVVLKAPQDCFELRKQ